MAKPPPDVGETNWRRIRATVKPLKKKSPSLPREGLGVGAIPQALPHPAPSTATPTADRSEPIARLPTLLKEGLGAGARRTAQRPTTAPTPTPPLEGRGLSSTPLAKDWERTLRTGRVQPDMIIDLHGHNLAGAHSALSRALDSAAASRARIILVIAGKARGPDEAPRGAIRRELATWLAHSHHAGRILAVRNAHPRHGGAGAVYLVLRKGVGR